MTRATVKWLAGLGLAITLAGAAFGNPTRSQRSLPAGYETARSALTAEGREVAELVRGGDADALFARFSPDLARAVPKSTVEQVLGQALASAPIGVRTGESALPVGLERRIYLADHRWGARTLSLRVVLDSENAIVGIDVRPPAALPQDPRADYRLRARVSLPFRGEWWVFWGGRSERQNYHVIASDQRHAYDFVAWRSGSTHRGSGERNADYWAWGRPIVAPANGVVVSAVDGVRDNTPQVTVENKQAPAGNHVVLDFGAGEYALLAHMRRGSVRVTPGQRVQAGDLLGFCGNSGNSSEPHLHFHVQDRAQLFGAARGLPVTFRGYIADGRRVARGTPVQGRFLRP